MITVVDHKGPRVLVSHIKRAACAVSGLDMADLLAASHDRDRMAVRQIAWLAAFRVCGDVPRVARQFNRDRKSIEHGLVAAVKLIERDANEREAFQEIERLACLYAAGQMVQPVVYRGSADAGDWQRAHSRGIA